MLATIANGSVVSLTVTNAGTGYLPGDIVAWRLDNGLPHIGIVTDRKNADGSRPLIMHNIGGGQVLEDTLFAHEITGHYRYGLE